MHSFLVSEKEKGTWRVGGWGCSLLYDHSDIFYFCCIIVAVAVAFFVWCGIFQKKILIVKTVLMQCIYTGFMNMYICIVAFRVYLETGLYNLFQVYLKCKCVHIRFCIYERK